MHAPFSRAQVERWDREWIHYLSTENPWPHLMRAEDVLHVRDITGLTRREMLETRVATDPDGTPLQRLRIWADADWIKDKAVFEFGSGSGFLSKNIGPFVERYLGIDVSRLAVAMASAGRHPRARFAHVAEAPRMTDDHGRFETWVGREFFIHQNFDMARSVLSLGLVFMAPGGRICADFYEPNPAIEQGVIHPARAPLDATYASCGFHYREEDVRDLAGLFDLAVDEQVVDLDMQRRYVVFRTP